MFTPFHCSFDIEWVIRLVVRYYCTLLLKCHCVTGTRVISPHAWLWTSGSFISHIGCSGTPSPSAHRLVWYVRTGHTVWWHTCVLGNNLCSCSAHSRGSPHAGLYTGIINKDRKIVWLLSVTCHSLRMVQLAGCCTSILRIFINFIFIYNLSFSVV
jgi:hypothetical protein